MVNTRNKGRRNEKKAQHILEDAGYDVELTKMPTKWAKQQDLFSLWDLIAVSHNEIRFIQVKSNRNAPVLEREEMKEWPCPQWASKEIWIFKDRVKKPVIKIL